MKNKTLLKKKASEIPLKETPTKRPLSNLLTPKDIMSPNTPLNKKSLKKSSPTYVFEKLDKELVTPMEVIRPINSSALTPMNKNGKMSFNGGEITDSANKVKKLTSKLVFVLLEKIRFPSILICSIKSQMINNRSL